MSKIKQVLELRSPSLHRMCERLVGSVQVCHYCSGSGWFWGMGADGEPEKQDCPMCKGSGWLRPVVNVEWEAVDN